MDIAIQDIEMRFISNGNGNASATRARVKDMKQRRLSSRLHTSKYFFL